MPTAALDIDLIGAVDQDVVDRVILQQRLDGPQAHHLVINRGTQGIEFPGIQRHALGAGKFGDLAQHLAAQFGLVQLVQLGQIQLVDQLGVQAQTQVKVGVPGRCLGFRFDPGRWRGNGCGRGLLKERGDGC